MVSHQYHLLFEDEPEYLEKSHRLSERCFEFSKFLVDVLGVTDLGAHLKMKAAYHPSCHLLRGLGVRTQPKMLLEGVQDLECVPFKDQEECCGFGGMFSVKNSGISTGMMENKLRNIQASGAETVVSCDMGCLMHLEGGLHRQGSNIKVKHLAQILDEGLS